MTGGMKIYYSKNIESNNNITGQWLNPGNYVGIVMGNKHKWNK